MFSANSSQVSEDRLYVEDVFSTYLYTGNGGTQTITNGIDLAGKGGLVWLKGRTNAGSNHILTDTARGPNDTLNSNSTAAAFNASTINWSFSSTGFGFNNAFGDWNGSGTNYASWTFREAPKFFDVVTYTGNGTFVRQINHSLGVTPGFIVVKRTDSTGNWMCVHRNNPMGELVLNSSAANTGNTDNIEVWTSTYIGVSNAANTNGATYVAYLFAHDTTSDGIIQCADYLGNGSTTGTTVTLGWEPQWVMIKRVGSASTSAIFGWMIFDNMRGVPTGGNDAILAANDAGAENSSNDILEFNATGFQLKSASVNANGSGEQYIYIAIRRGPMRTPTSGTSVFAPVTYTGNGSINQINPGFTTDMLMTNTRNTSGAFFGVVDRLRGAVKSLATPNTNAEATSTAGSTDVRQFDQNGYTYGSQQQIWCNADTYPFVNYAFRRAPSFFDVVCYTGTGVAGRTVSHNLGVAPEMLMVFRRTNIGSKNIYHSALGNQGVLILTSDAAAVTGNGTWNNTTPNSTTFTLNSFANVNGSGETYVAYLFASCPGVSKVGSYTGNGSSQTINCGFAAGARFVMIKRTDSTGDWYVWDTARGIVAGNDPRLSLNTTAAEVTTDDSVDTNSSGFVVNQLSATNINVSSATYIYLAVA